VSEHCREPDKTIGEVQHQVDPKAAFRRQMGEVAIQHDQCALAIDAHDFEAVQNIADNAVKHWLGGRAEFLRVIEGIKETSPYALAMRAELEKKRVTLLELLTRATETIAVPSMKQRVDRARAALGAANPKPHAVVRASPPNKSE
jgi:hypothetical protein